MFSTIKKSSKQSVVFVYCPFSAEERQKKFILNYT